MGHRPCYTPGRRGQGYILVDSHPVKVFTNRRRPLAAEAIYNGQTKTLYYTNDISFLILDKRYRKVRTKGRTDNISTQYRMLPVWTLPADSPYAGCTDCEAWFYHGRYGDLEEERRAIDKWIEHSKIHNKKTHTGNGAPQGRFAFTLTKSPKDNLTVADMFKAVRKIMTQKSNPVAKYAWYYEDKGRDANDDPIHPHIHGMYETTTLGRIERKHWKRAWSIWGEGDPTKKIGQGFFGGYHRTVKMNEAYSDYIRKDDGFSESAGFADETDGQETGI